jgi:hypothetical protein
MTRFPAAMIVLCSLAGCAHDPIPFLDGPSPYLVGPRQYMTDNEVAFALSTEDLTTTDVLSNAISNPDRRNAFVAAKMFIIDRNYNLYESKLGKENEFANLATSIASLGVSTAGATIPVGQTTKILAAVATGITGSKAAFDRDVLLTQTIQVVQTQMRADRALAAQTIRTRMSCSIGEYPLFLAMSDLESYRQAGTLEYALTSLAKLSAKAESDATAKAPAKIAGTAKASDEVEAALKVIGKAVTTPRTDCPIASPPGRS